MGFAVASQYNACGNVKFAQSVDQQLLDFKSTSIILVNKDAQFTNSSLVEVNLESPDADEVYVTNDSTCQGGGVWQPLVAARPWTLSAKNQTTFVYAKFRNTREGMATECLNDGIVHDDIAPSVVLQQPVLVTNIATPVVGFVADDQGSGLDKMYCQWPNEAVGPCQFSTSKPNTPEGRYLIKISASDRAGNVSVPVVQDLIVDRTPPVITLLSAPSATSSLQPSISYSVGDALSGVKSVQCAFDNKANYAPCSSPATASQADGSHKFYVRAFDVAGNMSELEHSYIVDSTAPSVTITKSPSDFSNSKSGTFEFEGKDGTEIISQFECRLDGGAYSACSSPKAYSGLAEGLRKFEVVGIDKVGNRSASAARSWFVDTVAPTVTFLLTPGALTNNTNPSFKYSIADAGSGVEAQECSLDGGAYAACAPDSMSYAALSAGAHNFRVRARDKAGNWGTSSTVGFEIDLSPPAVRLTDVPPAFSNLTAFNFKFDGTDDRGAIARAECRLDAGAYANCDTLTSNWARNLTEGGHRFTVRVADQAGNLSSEVSFDWTIDLTGPMVSYFQLPPASALSISVVSFGFTVADALSGVKSLVCKLDGSVTDCKSGEVKTLVGLSEGQHTFLVSVADNAGNVTNDSKTITISGPVLKNQIVEVKGNSKVDILVVMDNSGSMQLEQTNMAARFSTFLDKINGLDWQIGIISTDMTADAPVKDGRLVELKGMAGQYVLTSATPQTTAQTVFGNTIQLGYNGSGYELGFKATIRAIDRAFDTSTAVNAPNKALFRPDAALAVLVVSDAYDDSGTRPEDVVAKVTQRWGGNKPFVFHSIVVPLSGFTNPLATTVNSADPCRNYRESVQYDGREYHRLSDMTGGVKGTVCSEDYSAQLSDMGKSTVELVNSVTLNCQPLDYNGDNLIDARDVQVFDPSGQAVTGYTVSGMKVTFTSGLPLGNNSVKYYCTQ